METVLNKRTDIDLSMIFNEYGNGYETKYTPCRHLKKVFSDICCCRTGQLGGHINFCSGCGYQQQAYNSCRNRHCPKCQFIKQEQWADKVAGKLFPGRYFHIVFTIPEHLNSLFYINQPDCYTLLFSAAWEALRKSANNPSFLGAGAGAVALLHTWSQTLQYHPHIHMIVPAGGLSEDCTEWVMSKKNFFVPVKVLSGIFRGILVHKLGALVNSGKLRCPGNLPSWGHLKNQLYEKPWNVNSKKAFGGPVSVVKYLARYTHRVAISNNRLLGIKDDKISFRYKDNRDKGRSKIMELEAVEFIRRFMMHVLPKGFYKIRYYGVLASVNCKGKAEQCIALIGKEMYLARLEGLNAMEAYSMLTGRDPFLCPKCKSIMKQKPIAEAPG